MTMHRRNQIVTSPRINGEDQQGGLFDLPGVAIAGFGTGTPPDFPRFVPAGLKLMGWSITYFGDPGVDVQRFTMQPVSNGLDIISDATIVPILGDVLIYASIPSGRTKSRNYWPGIPMPPGTLLWVTNDLDDLTDFEMEFLWQTDGSVMYKDMPA